MKLKIVVLATAALMISSAASAEGDISPCDRSRDFISQTIKVQFKDSEDATGAEKEVGYCIRSWGTMLAAELKKACQTTVHEEMETAAEAFRRILTDRVIRCTRRHGN